MIFIVAIAAFVFPEMACKSKKPLPPEMTDTPISGKIAIVADESFAPLIKTEINTFSDIYSMAQIDASFLPEKEVVNSFFSSDKYRLMVLPRRLHDDEKDYFTRLGLPAREIKIAIDAIAFIVNLQNPDSNLTYKQAVAILNGNISSWYQVNEGSSLGKLTLVFDNPHSATVRFIMENVLQGTSLSSNAFAADSNMAVVNYVEKNPSALGIVGVSWIMSHDTSVTSFSNKIKVLAISRSDSAMEYYLPSKHNIYSLKYPFLRELFIVSQEKNDGLGTGFATYVASDEGQRIVQRFGLMPVDNAVRIIELRNQF